MSLKKIRSGAPVPKDWKPEKRFIDYQYALRTERSPVLDQAATTTLKAAEKEAVVVPATAETKN